MSLLTDKDITKLLGKDIVIDNFFPEGVTPVGYDFHVGDFVYSLDQCSLIKPVDGYYDLPPESTILILTRESLWVSKRIGGLFHSKVSLVTQGLSHIATTLDPNWFGPLLITFRNNNKTPFKLQENRLLLTFGEAKLNLEKMKKQIEVLVIAKGFYNRLEDIPKKLLFAFIELGEASDAWKKGLPEEKVTGPNQESSRERVVRTRTGVNQIN